MTQYEYKAHVVPNDGLHTVTEELNNFGAEGWLAIDIRWLDDRTVIHFVREISDN